MPRVLESSLSELEQNVRDTVKFLADITGEKTHFLNLYPEHFEGKLESKLNFKADMTIGANYTVEFEHTLEKREHNGERSWGVEAEYKVKDRKNKILLDKGYWSSESYTLKELHQDEKLVDKIRMNFILESIGGIDVRDVPFMDYESYTSESIKDDGKDSYFQSIYLALMCDLKERGVELPPIISKNMMIIESMWEGNVDLVKDFLENEVKKIGDEYEASGLAHAKAEAAQIIEFANERKIYHDKSVPLAEKVPYSDKMVIPGDNNKKYNILVVESFSNSFEDHQGTVQRLSRKLVKDLGKTGKYGGSTIFRTINISECIDLCSTGQIDAILMDAGYNNLALAQQSIEMLGGSIKGLQGDTEFSINRDLSGAREKEKWKNMIYQSVEANGHTPPPYRIIPTNDLEKGVGFIVDGMLKAKDPNKNLKDSYLDLHSEALMEAFEICKKADEAVGIKNYQQFGHLDPQSRERIELIHHKVDLRHLEQGSKLKKGISKENFFLSLGGFIESQISMNLETVTPYEIMQGLQAIDVKLHEFPEYAQDAKLVDTLRFNLANKISTAASQTDDTSFYMMGQNQTRAYLNVLGSIYLIVKNMKEQEHISKVYDQIEVNGMYSYSEKRSIDQVVGDDIIRNTLYFASQMSERLGNSKTVEFLLGYGKKLAELTDNVDKYHEMNTTYFDPTPQEDLQP